MGGQLVDFLQFSKNECFVYCIPWRKYNSIKSHKFTLLYSFCFIANQRSRPGNSRVSYLMILNSLGQSTGHKELIGMPTLHIGSRSSEFQRPKVKGFTFIVMGDVQIFYQLLCTAARNDWTTVFIHKHRRQSWSFVRLSKQNDSVFSHGYSSKFCSGCLIQ